MAERASNALFFLFLSILSCVSSGTLVGLSYHARRSNEAMSFIEQHNVKVFVSDQEALASLSNRGVYFDLYLNRTQLETLIFKPKPSSSLYWLKTHVNIKSVVATIGIDDDLTWVLPSLKSLHSVLTSFGIEKRVKVSVAFPFSLLVANLSTKHERDLCSVVSYVKKMKSFIIVETCVASIFPCNDIPIPKKASKFTRIFIKAFHSHSRRELLAKTTRQDAIYPTPTIVTVNPTPVTSTNPNVPIVTLPLTTPPVTNPVTTPVTVPGVQPITNPVTTNPTVVAPPASNIPGQTWCIARAGVPEVALQAALDYACGGGADCSQIQQGGSCYNPSTLQSHASYAFNSYFQRNPIATSCDFGGTAAMINSNPSIGSCVYPVSASAAPLTVTPVTPAPVVVPTPTVPTPTPTVTNPATVTPTPTWSTSPGSGVTPPPGVNASTGLGPEFGLDSPPGYPNSSGSNMIGSKPSLGIVFLLLAYRIYNVMI